MKLGYACMNRSLKLSTSNTTRLASITTQKIKEKLALNIEHLKKILQFNVRNNLMFFRIGSEFVPFASHTKVRDEKFTMEFNWMKHFEKELKEIGDYVKQHNIRISMHPDQFVLINSPDMEIFNRSFEELQYHAQLFNAMNLDTTHKFQIHLGGRYDDKKKSMQRFVDRYKNNLNNDIRARLVLENDDRLFSLDDVMWVHSQCGIPILFDTLHHECLNTSDETLEEAFLRAASTWDPIRDGHPMVDYSDQEPDARVGNHRSSIELKHFKKVICDKLMKCKRKVEGKDGEDGEEEHEFIEFDVMLEIKDKDASALKSLSVFLKGVEMRGEEGENIEEETKETIKKKKNELRVDVLDFSDEEHQCCEEEAEEDEEDEEEEITKKRKRKTSVKKSKSTTTTSVKKPKTTRKKK